MKFGKHLKSHRTAAWAYIDYGALKKLLNKLVGDDQGSENRSENAEVSEELFWSRLTADVKAFDADVKRRVDFAKQHLLVGGAQLRPRLAAVVLLEIDRLEQYINLNHEAVRKIVKKFVKKHAMKKEPAAPAKVAKMTWAKRLALRPNGCSKCRWEAGCSPSCLRK